MKTLYENPRLAGENAFLQGLKESDNPIDRRTHANSNLMWSLGWLSKATANGCKGIEIEPNVYSGCSGGLDCPICFGMIEANHE